MEIVGADARTAVHDNRNIACYCAYISDYVKVKLRLGQIDAVCGSEGTCQRIDPGICHKLSRKIRIGVDLGLIHNTRFPCAGFTLAHGAKLCLDGCPDLACHLDRCLCVCQVFFIRKDRPVIHDAGKAHIERLLQILQCLAVIQVYTHRNRALLSRIDHDRPDHRKRHPVFVALRRLYNNGQVELLSRPKYGNKRLQVRCVERPDRDFFLFCNIQYFF